LPHTYRGFLVMEILQLILCWIIILLTIMLHRVITAICLYLNDPANIAPILCVRMLRVCVECWCNFISQWKTYHAYRNITGKLYFIRMVSSCGHEYDWFGITDTVAVPGNYISLSGLLTAPPDVTTALHLQSHEFAANNIISGTVWDDVNGNGVADAGERGHSESTM